MRAALQRWLVVSLALVVALVLALSALLAFGYMPANGDGPHEHERLFCLLAGTCGGLITAVALFTILVPRVPRALDETEG